MKTQKLGLVENMKLETVAVGLHQRLPHLLWRSRSAVIR